MTAWHLTRRFFGALRPGGPPRTDTDWAEQVLDPAIYALWSRLDGPDRRHSVGVARRLGAALASTEHAGDRRFTAAALVHDVGKLEARLRVPGRVVATLCGVVAGRERAEGWSARRGFARRVGLYLQHPQLGEARILVAGGDPLVARWAGVHHDPPSWDQSGIPAPVVAALVAADDD